jgi:hypothetical protein
VKGHHNDPKKNNDSLGNRPAAGTVGFCAINFDPRGVMNLANETQSNLLVADRQHIYDAERLTVADMRGGPSPAAGRGGAQGGGRGGGGGWSNVAATNSGELISLAEDRAKQLVQAQQTAAAAAPGGRGGGGGNLSKLAPARGTGGGF